MIPMLLFLGGHPDSDLTTTTFTLRDGEASVFSCGHLFESGCSAETHPIVVVIDQPHVDQSLYPVYRVLEYIGDPERNYVHLRLESIQWQGFTSMRRSLKIGRLMGE